MEKLALSTSESLNRKDLNLSFYRESIKKYSPYNVKALHWNSKESQEGRFSSLIRIGNLHQSNILDIGCGTGDFIDYLNQKKITLKSYTGIDLIDEFIQVAKENHPEAFFYLGDFYELPIRNSFDYAFCNGALNIREQDNYGLLKNFILKTLSIVLKGFAFTLLKDSPHYIKDKKIFNYNEEKVSELLKSMNFNFKIYSDYADNDFSVFIYKD